MDFLSLTEIQKQIRDKQISPSELCNFYLEKIKKHNPNLNAFISFSEKALNNKALPTGALTGIPIAVKDVFCVKGTKTTAGSKVLKDYISPYTATVVKRLQEAGAIIIGKCNNDEFAMGSTGENSYFSPVKNPWNTKHVIGGSSSGSACAVAADLSPAALGTDTGGSVRLPAHYSHLLGIKPTYGRLSRYGMIAYASSLDQAGVFTRTVEDSALLLDIMSGFDFKDSTSVKGKEPFFQKNLNSQIKNKKVIYFDLEGFEGAIDSSVEEAQSKSLSLLKDRGCKLLKRKWPYLEYGLSVYYLISTAEASSNLSRYDGVRYGHRSQKPVKNLQEFYAFNRTEGFGPEVRRRILMGTFCLSTGYYEEYFHKACQVRFLIQQAFKELFKEGDLILSPVAGAPAPLLGEKSDPLKMYLNDQLTVFANLLGAPALSLPVGFSKNGLPIGIQLMSDSFKEQEILNTALALEQDLKINTKRPCGF